MAERSSSKHESPRRSFGKKSDKNGSREHCAKVQVEKEDTTKVVPVRAAVPAASTSQQAAVVCEPAVGDKLDKLTQLLSGFMDKFTHSGVARPEPPATAVHRPHDLSLSDGEITDSDCGGNDPLDCLDDVITPAHFGDSVQQGDFQKALDDLAGSFHGEEDKGDALSEKLANVLNLSLRRRPSDDSVKATAAKIKLPANVENMKVPVTNKDISQAMTTGGKLLDARLTRTNCLVSKAMVPVAKLISDIGENRHHPPDHYLANLNDCLRLLAAAFNYLNHIRKEVARIHVHDSALAQLSRWECEVGTNELFPFDVAKKCDEIHKTKKLGKPYYRQKADLPAQHKRYQPYYNKHHVNKHNTHSRYNAKPFLGQKEPRGRGAYHKLSR